MAGDEEEEISAMNASGATPQVTSVPGELHYLAPESTVPRRFTAPGASVNTGVYEPHGAGARSRD